MNIILGIDPGLRCTGYGIIEIKNSKLSYITHGHITTKQTAINQRLYEIYEKLLSVIQIYQPNQAAIEEVFVQKNIQSALKLGQARGAALVAVAQHGLPIHEYSPRQIKQAIVGYGGAKKEQIQVMVRHLLKMKETFSPDAADALAIAICHCNYESVNKKIVTLSSPRRRRSISDIGDKQQ